jgi:copper chaperone
MVGMSTTTYEVNGMTCDHCVRSVTEEITEVDGVSGVDVSLKDGTAVVSGDADPDAVRAAVKEAGFEVTGVSSAA